MKLFPPPRRGHFFASFGLKKLVILAILLVLTFLRFSTPLEAAGALRFVPAFCASDLDWVRGAEAAICAAVRFAEYLESGVKLRCESLRPPE